MSGIDVNANTDIGHHMSTLVRTATTIGANLEGRKPAHKTRSGPATPPSKPPRKFHKRAMSETGVVEHEQRRDRMEEGMANLAKETEQVYRLKYVHVCMYSDMCTEYWGEGPVPSCVCVRLQILWGQQR